jgi:hypothetical protein
MPRLTDRRAEWQAIAAEPVAIIRAHQRRAD